MLTITNATSKNLFSSGTKWLFILSEKNVDDPSVSSVLQYLKTCAVHIIYLFQHIIVK
jgi:hypothetical protein